MGMLDALLGIKKVFLDGVEQTQRQEWNFSGVEIEDDPTNERTNITVSVGGLGDRAATSVIGRSANSTGAAADIAAGADDRVLARSGGVLAFVQIVAGMIADAAVTDAKLRTSAARSVIGRSSGTVGTVADIAAGADDTVLARTGGVLAFATVATNMIANGAITAAKLAAGILEMTYSSASSSRALDAGDYYKTLRVDSSGAARTITLPKDATLNIPIGTHGLIRRDGANDVSVAAEDGAVTVNSSGDELKCARDQAQIYWEKEAANTYWIGGEKKA
jgi:hypothetical protein